jgi:DNA protecting protein DprA
MNLTRISTDQIPLFQNFGKTKVPKHLTIQSQDGDLSMLDELPAVGLAIVGTRHPQRRSIEFLEKTLYDLRNTDLIIVSGFARGIDSEAHELAIEYGLRTIAFLGCGIERDYPKENRPLRDAIIRSKGLMISQFEEGSNPTPQQFYERNGLIAGFSKAVWVVEAAEVSGSLNTATHAMKLNRDLYATSCFPWDHYYQGNVKLLSQKEPLRYPFADPVFSSQSFGKTWPNLAFPEIQQTSFFKPEAKSEMQKWVLELQSGGRECLVQTLMNFASQKGHTLGAFYHLFEAEIEAGRLRHDSSGRVDIIEEMR